MALQLNSTKKMISLLISQKLLKKNELFWLTSVKQLKLEPRSTRDYKTGA